MNTALATAPTAAPTAATHISAARTDIPPAREVPDALIICCALAWHGNALSGLDYDSRQIERLVTVTRVTHTTKQILQWRAHTTPSTWDVRWRWAHRVTRTHFTDAPGLSTLPPDHMDVHAAPPAANAPRG